MSLTILELKSKSAEALADKIVQPEVVDEFATLSIKLAKAKVRIAPLTKQVAALAKSILTDTDAVLDPGVPIVLPGIDFELQVGAQGKKTLLTDVERAFEILGFETFMKVASISVADIKAYMTPEQVAEVSEEKYKIKRRVKAVKL